MIRQTARRLWLSDLTVLQLFVQDAVPSGPQLDDVVGGRVVVGPTELEAAFGPRPPKPTPLPDIRDPGNPSC